MMLFIFVSGMNPTKNVKPLVIYQDSAVATRWTKWNRNLELYFAINNIWNSLLFLGRDDIEDTFDSLPGPDCDGIGLKYVTAIKKIR